MNTIYCRVSTANVNQSTSWDTQRTVCIAYAQKNHIRVHNVEQEICSGYQDIPRQLKKLLNSMKRATLIVTHIDRFCRNEEAGMKAIQQFVARRNTLILIENKLTITRESWPSQKDSVRQWLSMGHHESTRTSERIKRAVQSIKARGGYIGSQPPFGFRLMRNEQNLRVLVPVASEQPVYRLILLMAEQPVDMKLVNSELKRLAPSKKYEPLVWTKLPKGEVPRMSCANIAEILNDYGITRRSKTWQSKHIKNIVTGRYLPPAKRAKIVNRDDTDAEDNNSDNHDTTMTDADTDVESITSSVEMASLDGMDNADVVRNVPKPIHIEDDNVDNDDNDEEEEDMDHPRASKSPTSPTSTSSSKPRTFVQVKRNSRKCVDNTNDMSKKSPDGPLAINNQQGVHDEMAVLMEECEKQLNVAYNPPQPRSQTEPVQRTRSQKRKNVI